MDSNRDFTRDFLVPALQGLSGKQKIKIAIALDAAIAFGALEYVEGNDSFKDTAAVEVKYWDNVLRLKRM